jgi:hypothetical protein
MGESIKSSLSVWGSNNGDDAPQTPLLLPCTLAIAAAGISGLSLDSSWSRQMPRVSLLRLLSGSHLFHDYVLVMVLTLIIFRSNNGDVFRSTGIHPVNTGSVFITLPAPFTSRHQVPPPRFTQHAYRTTHAPLSRKCGCDKHIVCVYVGCTC